MANYVGALDQGTTSTRFMIFDHGGLVVGIHQKEHEQIFPKPGWVEHDPAEIWARSQEVIDGGAREREHQGLGPRRGRHHQPARDGRGLGPQHRQGRSTTRSSGRTRGPTRSSTSSRRTAARTGSARRSACRWRPTSPAPRSSGCSTTSTALAPAAEAGDLLFGNIDTWCIWNLTGGTNGGVHVTDVTNASRTMLMDLQTLDWDDEILALMGIPRSMLPAIKSSSAVYGQGVGDARRASRSPAISATSRPRCSARPASPPARRRTPTAPAASCS